LTVVVVFITAGVFVALHPVVVTRAAMGGILAFKLAAFGASHIRAVIPFCFPV
jgi:hypothetical protein